MYSYVTQLFTGGINKDIDPAAIDLTMGQDRTVQVLADSQNILFERGLAIIRPGLGSPSNPTLLPSNQDLIAIQGLHGAPYALDSNAITRGAWAITRDSMMNFHLWSLNGYAFVGNLLDAVEITGAGGSLPFAFPINQAEVNGVFLFGVQSGGMLRWDPTAAVYTRLVNPDSSFNYVTGHYARAVGAFGGNVSASLAHQTVGWSAQGDETNWTSLDAGVSTLADVSDSITGIKIAKGVVVLARTYGFHLGWATGTFPIIYNWRKHSDNSIGCAYPGTFKVWKDICFFMSDVGIHTFDLTDIEDIGEGVYKEINGLIVNSNPAPSPLAFIATSYNNDYRPSYNIVLNQFRGTYPESLQPHYMYDIREKKWSRHTYANNFSNAFWFNFWTGANPDTVFNPNIVEVFHTQGSSPTFQSWFNVSTDQIASVKTGQICLSNPEVDCQLDRVLVVYFASAPSTMSVTVNYIRNGVAQTPVNFNFTTTSSGWDKRWVDIRVTGDFFQVQASLPIATILPAKFKMLRMEFSEVGKVRT